MTRKGLETNSVHIVVVYQASDPEQSSSTGARGLSRLPPVPLMAAWRDNVVVPSPRPQHAQQLATFAKLGRRGSGPTHAPDQQSRPWATTLGTSHQMRQSEAEYSKWLIF